MIVECIKLPFTFLALKIDRQRLKSDKTELLNQIQEMQKTIDDKEEQLRDFIREFELQMKVSRASRIFTILTFLNDLCKNILVTLRRTMT